MATISPTASYGEQTIVISGRAKDRATGAAMPNAALKIVLQVAGFQRTINIGTDSASDFSFSFVPRTSDAGTYVVSVIHPEETTLPNLGQFTINRLSFSPTTMNLSAIREFALPFNINATASAGLGAAGVHFQVKLFASLGADTGFHAVTYHASLKEAISEVCLDTVRVALNTGQALGSEKFKDQIEAVHRGRVRHLSAGRKRQRQDQIAGDQTVLDL